MTEGSRQDHCAERSIVLSIVVPMYNEEDNVQPLVSEVVRVVGALHVPYEIVLVDDGSRARTWEQIKRVAAIAPNVIGVALARNFGHQRALLAGLSYARGQAAVSMDGDLEHPPGLIAQLRYQLVNTLRSDRAVSSAFKRDIAIFL